jgi:NAD+ synthase (glutamine-hydrolysing)
MDIANARVDPQNLAHAPLRVSDAMRVCVRPTPFRSRPRHDPKTRTILCFLSPSPPHLASSRFPLQLFLANDGNYRESRWFTPWSPSRGVEEYRLPDVVRRATGQAACPIGIAVLAARDGTIAAETCEELFTPDSPHIKLSLNGVDIITNGSGSHHQLRKLNTRVDLMRGASSKCGGVYVYANQQGCDGGRLYFDGCAMVLSNGECVGQGSQFSLKDVEVVTATVDLEDVRSYRGATASRNVQAAAADVLPRINIDFSLCRPDADAVPTPSRDVRYLLPEEEIGLGPACWLWDYLRRCGASGFFLPLSGGADSASTCAIVGIMCHLVVKEVVEGNEMVLADLRRITGEPDFTPTLPSEVANRIMHTCYMGTSNSGKATQRRAETLASQIGVYHSYANIDRVVSALVAVFLTITETLLGGAGKGKPPRFVIQGGTMAEDLALQNIQARTRMVLAYMLAQLLPWVRGRSGWLLVLGSANVDEALRGYMTKYDCSSADVNPIGAVSKRDLKAFLKHSAVAYGWSALADILHAPPTAELRPIVRTGSGDSQGPPEETPSNAAPSSMTTTAAVDGDGADGEGGDEAADGEHSQLDEVDMGMSYDELSW